MKVGIFLGVFIIFFAISFSFSKVGKEAKSLRPSSRRAISIPPSLTLSQHDQRFKKEINVAFDAFENDVVFGIHRLSELGLTEDALIAWVRKFFSKLNENEAEIDWETILNDITYLESERLEKLVSDIVIYEAMSSNRVSSVLDFLVYNRPDGLITAGNYLWNKDQQEALRVLSSLSNADAEFFLVGSLSSTQGLSSESLGAVIPKIRGMSSYDKTVKNMFEVHLLTQNINGNHDLVEKFLITTDSEVVRNKVLPLLAKDKFQDDIEKAITWTFQFEGEQNTQPVQELRKQAEGL